ncbi:MAG TPA: tetratricopeptide repeat protein [Candidatus Aminicenantes bacterium]|nr:tetratricopeptide repeat protein [Candidatus Aminicenantes bacterium]
MTKYRGIFAIVCILALPLSLMSQTQGKGKMRGTVVDQDSGLPLEGVTVRLFSLKAREYRRPDVTTDKEGKGGAYFIKDGMWTVEFEKVGYMPQRVSFRVTLDPSERQPDLDVTLAKIQGMIVKDVIVKMVDKGNQLYSEKKYDEARGAFEQILAESPEIYIIHKSIGNCYFAQENYEKAVGSYMKVYEKQKDDADILSSIANAYNNWGKKEEALEWYKKIPPEKIKDTDTSYNAGVSIYNSGNPEEAAKYFRKAIEINPEFSEAYYLLGMASVALNKTDEALEAFNKFLALDPESPNAATAQSIIDTLSK